MYSHFVSFFIKKKKKRKKKRKKKEEKGANTRKIRYKDGFTVETNLLILQVIYQLFAL
jgi:hypothetical protein